MGTIAQKGAYLNDTKSQLKQAINNLGGSITDETTFRQYVDQLGGVYDVLPKTSFQEGTEVTIENGLKGKIDFDDGKVGFGQASQESTNGYQLYPIKNIAETTENGITYSIKDGVMSINGTATSSFSISIVGSYGTSGMSLTAGSYTWGYYNVSGSYTGVFGKYLRPTGTGTAIWDGSLVDYLSTKTLEQDYNSLYSVLYIGTGASFNNLKFKLMICKGTYTAQTIPNWEPYTGGYASPSPNWEQPIQCVTGNQEIVESGKNLFLGSNEETNNFTATYQNNVLTIVAKRDTTGNNVFHRVKLNQDLLKNGETYVISSVNVSGVVQSLKLQLRNKNGTSAGLPMNTSVVYDNNYDLYVVGNVFGSASTVQVSEGQTAVIKDIQVEEGSSATTYEPYHTPITYPISLGNNKFYNIGTYRDYILRTTGKNLVNPTEIKDASINSTTGDTITYYSSSASKTYVKCAYVKQGVAYTFSKKPNTPSSSAGRIIDIVDDNEVILEAFSVLPSATSYTYTPNHSGWVYMVVDVNATEIQIEEGSTASDYQPYGVGNWYKYGEVGEILLDGTNQSFSGKSGFTTNHVFFTLPISDILAPPNNDTDVNMLSNYFLHCKINALASNRIGFGCRSDKMLGFGFTLESQLDTLEKANTWLTTHNIDVLYPLATPTYTPITGDLATQLEAFWNAHSNTGTTILESNGDLPMIIKVRALKGE